MLSRTVAVFAAVALMAGLVASQDTLDDLYLSLYNLTENKNTVTEPPAPPPAPAAAAAPVAAPAPAPAPAQPRYTCTGECVQYYLCSDNKIITDGAGIIDIRVGEDPAEEYECPHFLNTCCEKDSVLVEPPPSATKAPPTSVPDARRPTCGMRNENGIGFRIEGQKDGESEYGEFPWMLAVLREERVADSNLNVYECGASLIAPNVVLTAAHCVFNKQKEQLLIRAGEWDTQTRNELYQHQDRRVAEVITHEAFNKASLANDVALLILTEPFQLAENVQPICLPPKGTSFDRSKCFASGWGKNVFGKEGKYQVILKKVELPVVPHTECQQSLRSTRLGKRFALHQSFLCAGGVAGKDTCRGDGGSPLVCPIPGSPTHYYQAGIVAWGIGCGENGIPGVYGNVAFFRDWIDQQLVQRSILARDYVYTP
uniref:Phenoloxidase-activating factor 2 n=1 Tax=Anopheles melas TaxID=34690 RepID=A0A2C9H4V7_9DIPT